MKFGRGRIVADDAPLFDAVGKMLTLTLENGAEMQILIDQLSIGSGEASVNSSGPIPGF